MDTDDERSEKTVLLDGDVLGMLTKLQHDPPMDEASYKAILALKSKGCLLQIEGTDDEFTEEGFRLRQDLAFGKVRWYGEYPKDLWCYLRNNNPIFSICYSHPLHPIERWERYYIYLTIIIFKMSLAVLITRAAGCIGDGATTCSEAREMIVQAKEAGEHDAPWHLCCLCSRLGIRFAMQHLGTQWGARLYLLVVGALYAVITFQFAACSCASRYHSTKKRHWMERVGHAVIAIITLVVLVVAYHPLRYCIHTGTLGSAFFTFVIAQSMSWLGATLCVPGLTCFTFLNWKEQRKEWDGINWNVTWEDYQKYSNGELTEVEAQSTLQSEEPEEGAGCFRGGLCSP